MSININQQILEAAINKALENPDKLLEILGELILLVKGSPELQAALAALIKKLIGA
jgi:hypothetical protein